jgi:uncharacterized protein YqeY
VKQKFQDDLKTAMKSGDKLRTMTLRGFLSEITRVEKDVRREANEAEIVQILKRERARRDEVIEFARKGGGQDEVKAAVAAQVSAGVTQIGPIMKALRDQFGARLDGKMASDLVKQALAPK